jgi:hypothetical protein
MLYMNKLIIKNGKITRKYSSDNVSYDSFPMEDIDLYNTPPAPNNSPVYQKYISLKHKIKKKYFCCNM